MSVVPVYPTARVRPCEGKACVLCTVYGISPHFKWPYVSGEGEGEAKLVYKAYLANKRRYQLCDWK